MSQTLFPDPLIAEMRRLPGASHSFLRQICQVDGDEARAGLQQALGGVDPTFRLRLHDLLHSLDNRRFFQGYAELATLEVLHRAGWQGRDLLTPGPLLAMTRPDGSPVNVLVLAYLTTGRMEVEDHTITRLRQALERVNSRLRFGIFVRKWLPHDFEPEPVRQAVEMWLKEVEGGAWEGRYAAYEDESVSLEFGLTGERAEDGQGVVVLTLGPFMAGRTVQVLEATTVRALDRYHIGPHGKDPVLLVAVGDQPWQLSRGYMREFLFGKPTWVATAGDAQGARSWEAAFEAAHRDPCLFKDPLYRNVIGMVLLERPIYDALGILGRGFSNPFATSPLLPAEAPFRVLAEGRREGEASVVRWFPQEERVIRLGSLA